MKRKLNRLREHIVYQVIMSLLAIMSIVLFFIEMNLKNGHAHLHNIKILDYSIIVLFAVDYCIGLYTSKDKKVFIKNNILELLSIIPFSLFFQSLRLLLILRLFRTLVFIKVGLEHLRKMFKTNGIVYVVIFSVVLILLSSYVTYLFEHPVNKNFHSYGDALWWAVVTATTVGYGDIFPITFEGRIIGAILMIVGIGFISFVSASLATYFMRSDDEATGVHDKTVKVMIGKINELEKLDEKEIKELTGLIHYLWEHRREKEDK